MKIPKIKKHNWTIIKVLIINWTLIALVVSAYVVWIQQQKIDELSKQNQIYQNNMEEILKQYPNQSIRLELRK